MDIRPQKRIFIGLLVFTCLVLLLFISLLWYVPLVGLNQIHDSLPYIFTSLLAASVFLMISGGLLLVFTIVRGKDIFLSQRLRGIVAKVLFPFVILMGRLVGVSKEKVKQSFIELNNHLVLSHRPRTAPERLLILLPHCLQDFDCKIKITANIRNCKGCGKCQIKSLIELSSGYGVHIAVATGGTLARRIVVEHKPEAIIAVACELDLTSGIQDTHPIPVIGILNQRPNGPCMNTVVDIEKVKSAILSFLQKPELPVGTAIPSDAEGASSPNEAPYGHPKISSGKERVHRTSP